MAKYTTEVRQILSSLPETKHETRIFKQIPLAIPVLFPYDLGFGTPQYQHAFLSKFLHNYAFHEIGCETLGEWLYNIENQFMLRAPKYQSMLDMVDKHAEHIMMEYYDYNQNLAENVSQSNTDTGSITLSEGSANTDDNTDASDTTDTLDNTVATGVQDEDSSSASQSSSTGTTSGLTQTDSNSGSQADESFNGTTTLQKEGKELNDTTNNTKEDRNDTASEDYVDATKETETNNTNTKSFEDTTGLDITTSDRVNDSVTTKEGEEQTVGDDTSGQETKFKSKATDVEKHDTTKSGSKTNVKDGIKRTEDLDRNELKSAEMYDGGAEIIETDRTGATEESYKKYSDTETYQAIKDSSNKDVLSLTDDDTNVASFDKTKSTLSFTDRQDTTKDIEKTREEVTSSVGTEFKADVVGESNKNSDSTGNKNSKLQANTVNKHDGTSIDSFEDRIDTTKTDSDKHSSSSSNESSSTTTDGTSTGKSESDSTSIKNTTNKTETDFKGNREHKSKINKTISNIKRDEIIAELNAVNNNEAINTYVAEKWGWTTAPYEVLIRFAKSYSSVDELIIDDFREHFMLVY